MENLPVKVVSKKYPQQDSTQPFLTLHGNVKIAILFLQLILKRIEAINMDMGLDKKHQGDYPIGIDVYYDAVSDCEDICGYLDTQEERQSGTAAGVMTDVRNSKSVMVDFLNPYMLPESVFNMNKVVWEKLNTYATKWGISLGYIEPISVQKYEPGEGFYKTHHDGLNRAVSALVYLNDVQEGGETVFPEFDLAVKPERGKMVIFPSNYIYRHAATIPVSNTKYAAAIWAHENSHGHGGHKH
jgi:hypothetical protein